MIFQRLLSIRSTHSTEYVQSDGGNLPVSENVEWDGGGGFQVSLQVLHSEKKPTDGNVSGRFRKVLNVCRVGGTVKSTLRDQKQKRSLRNDDELRMTSATESTFCESNDCQDTLSEKVTVISKSSSCGVRRKVARCVLTSLLSAEDESMGPHLLTVTTVDLTANVSNSETECNVYENTLDELQSFDDTVFDGLLQTVAPTETNKMQNSSIAPTDKIAAALNFGKITWPCVSWRMCFDTGMNGSFQETPANQTVKWKHQTVLSPLSY